MDRKLFSDYRCDLHEGPPNDSLCHCYFNYVIENVLNKPISTDDFGYRFVSKKEQELIDDRYREV